MSSTYLSGVNKRAAYMRMDAAKLLKRFFLCEEALVISQGAWLAAIGVYHVKMALPRMLWEDAMCANAERERVFELRFPSRVLEPREDTALAQLFAESLHAPGAAAFVLSLARVYKPALLAAYQTYLDTTDEIADGPSMRFLQQATREKTEQIARLTGVAEAMLAAAPNQRAEAESWVAEIEQRLAALGGVYAYTGGEPMVENAHLPGSKLFALPDTPAREPQFHLCRFYWPDVVDPTAEYTSGLALQVRSAISHFNEVWAVETAGAILHAFAARLGWPFIYDAARWTYDESRHCRMGYERLKQWGYADAELPLGSYIYESAAGQEPVYRLGMLFFFETKNIHKKQDRIKAFSEYEDAVSQHDMEYDWADETIHAHYGKHWLTTLAQSEPDVIPAPEVVRERCSELVEATLATATDTERAEIHAIAAAIMAKARNAATSQ